MDKDTGQYWNIRQDAIPWSYDEQLSAKQHRLPDDMGDCLNQHFDIDDGLSLIQTHYHPDRNLAVMTDMPLQAPRMVLTLTLKGQSCFQSQQGSESIDFRTGYTTITTFNASQGCRLYNAGQQTLQLRFCINQEWLEGHFGTGVFAQFFSVNGFRIISERPISMYSLSASQNLLQIPANPRSHALFRSGLSSSLVAEGLGHLLNDDQQQTPAQRVANSRLLQEARDILYAEYKNPPSITTLCKRIGTNPFKLKQLFREHLNTTPYGFLMDIRMQHAAKLLKNREMPINLIAEAVGYQHPGNFSAAFSRYFGSSPKTLKKQGL